MKRSQILSMILLLALTVFSCLTTANITYQTKEKAEIPLNPNRKILIIPAFLNGNNLKNSSISSLMEDSIQQFFESNDLANFENYLTNLKSKNVIDKSGIPFFSPLQYSKVCGIMDNDFLSAVTLMNQWAKVLRYQPSLNDLNDLSLGKSHKDLLRTLDIDTIVFPIVTKMSSTIEFGWDTDTKYINKLSVLIKVFDISGSILVERDYNEMMTNSSHNNSDNDFNTMSKSIAKRITAALAPKTASNSYTMAYDPDEDPRLKEAGDLAKLSKFEESKVLFIRIFQETKNISAAINAAIIYRALDDLAGGVAFLEEAVKQTQNKKLQSELEKINKDLIESEKTI